jgi:hypothetical protein
MTIVMVEKILVQNMQINSAKTKLYIVTTVCTSEGIENPPRIEYAIQINCSHVLISCATAVHGRFSSSSSGGWKISTRR